jgi:hypothetical protein
MAREGPVRQLMHIGVYKLQRARGAPLSAQEGVGMHLTCEARLTDRIRRSLDIKLQSSDQLVLIQRPHTSKMMVSQPAVPQREIKRQSRSRLSKLSDSSSRPIQEGSIVVIDGGDEERRSRRTSEHHMSRIDIDNKARVAS